MDKNIKMGVWIDQNKALIVTLAHEEISVETVESDYVAKERVEGESKQFTRMGDQYANFEKKKEQKTKHLQKQFLATLSDKLNEAEAILICGPAFMKNELEKMLADSPEFKDKTLRIQTADSMTDNQFIALVKSHFNF